MEMFIVACLFQFMRLNLSETRKWVSWLNILCENSHKWLNSRALNGQFFLKKISSKVHFIYNKNRQNTPEEVDIRRVPKSTQHRTWMSLHWRRHKSYTWPPNFESYTLSSVLSRRTLLSKTGFLCTVRV